MAIKTYSKGKATQLSTNFKSTEFDCHGSGCCSTTQVDEKLVEYLQNIRNHFGKPVNISSGYRCATHNKNIGGATGSKHSKGQAADIYINGVAPAEIAKYAESIGILGIGLYETDKDGHFVHVDTRTSKSFWYGQSEAYRSTFGGTQTTTPSASKVDTSAIDAKKMWDYFKSKGLNDYGVAGLMGNLYCESALRPCNLQQTYEKKLGYTDETYTIAVDNGSYTNFVNDSAGYGLAQWTYWSLKQDMLNYHKSKGKSIGDGNTQMEFLAHQLSNSYKSVWTTLQTAKSVLEASNAVLLKFERPADQSVSMQNKRAAAGQKYYDAYASKSNVIELPKEGVNGKMKYSEKNKPLVCMHTESRCYHNSYTMKPLGVLWHSTGANNPTLKRYVAPSSNDPNKAELLKLIGKNSYGNDWNREGLSVGVNAFIGKLADGSVTSVQTLPWDMRPWGCASGPKGSCNSGWIQFEICEDGLSDKNYFNKVYQEACELTAYLCELYDIDPNGTVTVNGVKVPTILCHADSHRLGFGSNHGDVLHWFPKHGKDMDDVRADVAKLMKPSAAPIPQPATPAPEKELYRVRKSWGDSKSQIGAYGVLENAKVACDKAGPAYSVFNSKGEKVYPASVITPVQPTPVNKFPYLVKITASVLNVRAGAGTNYKIRTQVRKNEVYTIIDENNGWGKLKSGAGWICLDYVKKV